MEYVYYGIAILVFFTFLYFGYRNDFRRNKKEFIYTVSGVMIFFISWAVIQKSSVLWGLIVGGTLMTLSGFFAWKVNKHYKK